jgi:hypothetical protein
MVAEGKPNGIHSQLINFRQDCIIFLLKQQMAGLSHQNSLKSKLSRLLLPS